MSEYIEAQPGLEVCGAVGTGEAALQALPAGADVIAVDLSLGGGMTGLELVEEITTRWPDLPCVVLSAHAEVEKGAAARTAGAAAYVEKGDPDHLIAVLRRLLSDPSSS